MSLKSTKSTEEHSSNTRFATIWGHLIILAKQRERGRTQCSTEIMNLKILSKDVFLDVFLIINSAM